VVVIPNGVDVDRFAPQPERRRAIRAELGIAADAPAAGILAALRPEKNHELFLRAAARVRVTLPAARFVVIGDGPERPAVEGWIDELGLREAVLLLGNRSDVPDVLAALDVLALTSHMEANPVSILEAMSTGLPVVATNVGSVSESVREGVTGFLVPAGDEPALAARLTETMNDCILSTQFGRVGREHVIAHSSLGNMVQGYEELLTSLYERKTSQRLLSAATKHATTDDFAPALR
jgi:glycosyltransferase involved in cell wall biosynthesis